MKVGLKETLSLLAAGYKKKDIDAMIAAETEAEQEAVPEQAPSPAPVVNNDPAPVVNNDPAPDDAAAKESNQESDYKKMYEELLEKNKQTEAKVTKLQQDNIHKDSAPASEEQKKKQEEDLQSLFRSYM